MAQIKTPPELAIPKISGNIKIDGYLNEPAWKAALKVDDFYTYYPVDGKPADEKTAVLFGYDESSLYIAVICFDSSPELIRASISKRDEILDDDHVVLFLDTFNSGKESYEFCINPYGIQADGIYIDMVSQDFTPDYIYYSKGRIIKNGYIVEMEIPFKSLRFPSNSDQIWGVSIMRSIKHSDKELIWPAISLNSTTFIPQFAKIKGMDGITSSKNIELLPEFTTTQQGNLTTDTTGTDKFQGGSVQYELGINLKFGVLSNLTLDLTYNPDFSQVEADADKIDVNRRFPLYYDEKRPFFLEGTNIFNTPINAVYTRRIVDPRLGLKLSGKVDGLEIGLLSGIDEYYGSEEYLTGIAAWGPYYDPSFDRTAFMDKYRNAQSFHNIIRLRKDIWNYSHLGLLVTDKRFKDTYSTTYGFDGTFLIADEYSFTFQALHSQSKDLTSNNYKKDPAFHALLFRGSRTFNFQLYYDDIFPNFEVANGFLERTDYREGGLQVHYDIRSEDSFFPLVRPILYTTLMYNHDGEKIESYMAPMIMLETKGNNSLTLAYYRQFEEYTGFGFDKNWYWIDLISKTFSKLFFNFSAIWGDGIYYDAVYFGIDPFLGRMQSLQMGLEFKPLKNWATNFQLKKYLFRDPENSEEYRTEQNIYRLRTNFQFSREFFLRLILEHNDYYKDLDVNLLFSYQPSPGTVLFLGYNDYLMDNRANKYIRHARGLFAKLSYLFRF